MARSTSGNKNTRIRKAASNAPFEGATLSKPPAYGRYSDFQRTVAAYEQSTERSDTCITTTLHSLLTRLSTGIGQHPYVTAVVFFFGLGLVLLWSPAQRGTAPRPAAKLSPLDPSELDRALVERYETRFDGLQAQVQRQQRQFEATHAEQRKLTEDLQRRLDHGLAELRQLLTTRPATTTQAETPSPTHVPTFRHIAPQQQQRSTASVPRATHALEIPSDNTAETDARPTVQLPAGSFVSSILLTGAYAPADQERPLPVLLRINEGFTGPNLTRAPLQACFVVGKAAADLGAERATIRTARLSCTLPSGQVFEQDVSGYVAARDGLFGVPGTLIRHDAAKLGMASVTRFLSGAAQAISRAESTTVFSPGVCEVVWCSGIFWVFPYTSSG